MLKIFLVSTYYQFVIFARIKEALFFSIVFPLFLFILFCSIWGGVGDTEYITFLLSGVICMTVSSEGMFAIANVIKQYYSNNFIKVIRNLPYNITVHILSLCLSRLIVLFSVLILLILCSFYLFHVKISFELILLYLSGIVLGLTIFTFFGLCISFSSNTGGGRGAISFIYYIMLFLSNALFSIGKVNPVLNIISHIFPLTPLTAYMRGEYTQLPVILIWLAGLIIIFNIIYSKKQIKR